MTRHSAPIIVATDRTVTHLERVPFAPGGATASFSEDWLQKLLFDQAEVLPCAEIDPAYSNLIPLCRELGTPAGPIDLAYVTPHGKLVLVETKLWRNPQARREVVAQILDYAKELSRWEYEDLERQVMGASRSTPRTIFERVSERHGNLEEATFCDQVPRTLRTGQFLLLIVGDGIREGVGAMADFLDRFGSLQFSFGLIEVGVFDLPTGGRLVQPTVLAKTVIVKRTVVAVESAIEARILDEEDAAGDQPTDDVDPKQAARTAFLRKFWAELLDDLRLDDASQPMAKPGAGTNIYFPMPPSGSTCWVSAYFALSKRRVGVYLTFSRRSAFGEAAWTAINEDAAAIRSELGFDAGWEGADGKYWVFSRLDYKRLEDPQTREQVREFFKTRINRFVSVFRPRLSRIAAQM